MIGELMRIAYLVAMGPQLGNWERTKVAKNSPKINTKNTFLNKICVFFAAFFASVI
jgi:hypothetical protein